MKLLNKKIIIVLFFLILLAGCSLRNLTEKQKVIDYLLKSDDYKKYNDEYDRTFYVLNIEGDVNSDYAYYYNNDIDYAYYSIYEDNFEYVYEEQFFYGKSIIHSKFTYNPITNISDGSYVLNIINDENNIMANVHKEYSYMYNYNTGTSECAYKSSLIAEAEPCVISGESQGKKFLQLKEDYLMLLKSSGVSENSIYNELSR